MATRPLMVGEEVPSEFSFVSQLWRWEVRRDNWFFVTVPEYESDVIAGIPRPSRGFGGVRVEVTVGNTTWQTSIFPDSKRGCYVLPMKKAILNVENLMENDKVKVELKLL